eukprot:4026475-Amphidinium_carterae.1
MNNNIYQATRQSQKHDEASAEHINMKAAIAIVKNCEELLNLHKLAPSRRQFLLETVLGPQSEEVIPPKFRSMLVVQRVREQVAKLSVGAFEDWIAMLHPFN